MKEKRKKGPSELRHSRFWTVLIGVVAVALVYALCLTAISAGWFGSLDITPESVEKVVEAHEASKK
jgi:cytochrome c-type biogenesis protein CcmE